MDDFWAKVESFDAEFEEKDLVDVLLEEYEVEPSRAIADVKSLVASWKEAGLVE